MGFALKVENLPKYTYEDFCQWEGRWELIGGVPYAMSPLPTGKHQKICRKLLVQLEDKLQECAHCNPSLPMDWKIDEHTILEPDLFVACFDFDSKKFISQPPVIVVEVLSPSTRDKDLSVKYDIYKEQGVKYYVILDPDNDTYTIHQLSGKDYKIALNGHDGTFTFEIEDDCHAEINFGKLWE